MQKQGVPIGGLVSRALCSVLLGFAVHQRASMEAAEARLPGHVKAWWKNSNVKRSQRGSIFFTTSDGTNRAEWLDVVFKLEPDGTLCLSPQTRRAMRSPLGAALREQHVA